MCVLPAQAQFLERSPLGAGFWSFPPSPTISASEIEQSCRTGYSLVFEDGGSLSFYKDDADRWVNDGNEQCTYDAGARTLNCTGTHLVDGKFSAISSTSEVSLEPDGRFKLATVVEGATDTVVTYPARCPDSAVRDSLQEAYSQR